MSISPAAEHRAEGPARMNIAILTVSDTRTLETDTSGRLIVELAEGAGHHIAERAIVPDEPARMRPILESWRDRGTIEAVLVTGGTGIAARDLTYETVNALLTKPLPGYGELFRMLSYQEIGAAAMLSRAVGGLMNGVVLLVMPGSRAAVELAMTRLILPELPHLVREARKA
jgi:molybdenum cofactor biosynthesis protein B